MADILQFPTRDTNRDPAFTFDVTAIARELENEELPVEDQLAEMFQSLNTLDFEGPCKQRVHLDFESREVFRDEGDEPPFWAEQYREACSEVQQAYDLINRAKTRLSFTIWHAFPKGKAVNADWMDAHVGKAHKAIVFETFLNQDGKFYVSASRYYDGRIVDFTDAEMAIVGYVLQDNGFQRYDHDGDNGPQWFMPGEPSDELRIKIGKDLELHDFLAVGWEDIMDR